MPSTYAHYKFGEEVLKKLPTDLRRMLTKNIRYYNIGLHGPDILFYYNPLFHNAVNQQGFSLHDKSAILFFKNAIQIIGEQNDKEAAMSYIMGFICHFALDSECHPYIEEKIRESQISHTEIEVEFDRMLMVRDGYNPIRHPLTGHIEITDKSAGVIAPFFENLTKEEVMKALNSMKYYNGLLIAKTGIKRQFIYLLLKLTKNYKEMHGLVVNKQPNEACRDSCEILDQLFKNGVLIATRLINEYKQVLEGKTVLGKRFCRTYGADLVNENQMMENENYEEETYVY